eukprot:scaffold17378_cov78-Phaeocystis_antarctica.AAC.2
MRGSRYERLCAMYIAALRSILTLYFGEHVSEPANGRALADDRCGQPDHLELHLLRVLALHEPTQQGHVRRECRLTEPGQRTHEALPEALPQVLGRGGVHGLALHRLEQQRGVRREQRPCPALLVEDLHLEGEAHLHTRRAVRVGEGGRPRCSTFAACLRGAGRRLTVGAGCSRQRWKNSLACSWQESSLASSLPMSLSVLTTGVGCHSLPEACSCSTTLLKMAASFARAGSVAEATSAPSARPPVASRTSASVCGWSMHGSPLYSASSSLA